MRFQQYTVVFCIPLLTCCLITPQSFASPNTYTLILSIMSYSTWSIPTPTLCVIDNAQATQSIQTQIHQQNYPYQVLSVTQSNFIKKQCQAVYFSKASPQQQQVLINNYPSKVLLSFSSNNSECEIGSIFCLSTQHKNSKFRVNLDALSHAQIRIDPRVLLLAKNGD